MAAAGLTRCACLLLVLLVAVNGVGEQDYSSGQSPFFYQGTPGHVTTTPEPETTPIIGEGTWTSTPYDGEVTSTYTPEIVDGQTVTLTGGLGEGAKIAIGVVGGTAAAAGLALGGVLLHNSGSPSSSDEKIPVTFPPTTTPRLTLTLSGRPENIASIAGARGNTQANAGSSASSGDSSGTVSFDSSVPASASWLFWLLFLAMLCCCCACVGGLYYLYKSNKKKSRKVGARVDATQYAQVAATDTMPLMSPPPVEAGPLTDSRVKLSTPEYAYTAAPATYTTTMAAPAVYTQPPPAITYSAAAPTVLQPANVTTVYASQVAQPTADFGTPITGPPQPARIIQGGIQ